MSFVRRLGPLLLVAGLSSCTTAPPVPSVSLPVLVAPVPPAPISPVDSVSNVAADKIAAANAVYRARVERSGGFVHYIVAEIWRHDPVLGSPPQIGVEWALPHEDPGTYLHGDEVFIYIGASQLSPGRAGSRSTGIAAVTRGPLVAGQTPLTDLHIRVASTAAAAKLVASGEPTLDECLTASGIYLARMDLTDSDAHFIVTEIWRHRQSEPGPAVGAEVVLPRKMRSDMPLITDGEQAVVFLFSPPLVRASGQRLVQANPFVVAGNVPVYHLTVAALRARIIAAN